MVDRATASAEVPGPKGAGFVPWRPDIDYGDLGVFNSEDNTGHAMRRQADLGINPMHYGAKGDGTTNDRAILAEIFANEQHVSLPKRTFLCNDTAGHEGPIQLLSGQTITSSGGELLCTSGPNNDAIFLIDGQEDVNLNGLRARLTAGNRIAVYVRNSKRVGVQNCHFGRLNSLWNGGSGIFFAKSCEDVAAIGNYIYGTLAGIATGGDPLGGDSRADGTVLGALIAQNFIYGAMTEAIDINWDTAKAAILGNVCRRVGRRGDADNQMLDIGGSIAAVLTASITGNVLTVSAVAAATSGTKGAIAINDMLFYAGIPAGPDVKIIEQVSGTPNGAGVYTLNRAPGNKASMAMYSVASICRDIIATNNIFEAADTSTNGAGAQNGQSGAEIKQYSKNIWVRDTTIIGKDQASTFGVKHSNTIDCGFEGMDIRGMSDGGFCLGIGVRPGIRRSKMVGVTHIGVYTGDGGLYNDVDFTDLDITGNAASENGVSLRDCTGVDVSRLKVRGGFTSATSGLGRGLIANTDCTGVKAKDVEISGCNINVTMASPSSYLSGKLTLAVTYGLDAVAADLVIGDLELVDNVTGLGNIQQGRFQASCNRLRIAGLISVDDTRGTPSARGLQFQGGDSIHIAVPPIVYRFGTAAITVVGASMTNFSGDLGPHAITIANLPSTARPGATAVVNDANATTAGGALVSAGGGTSYTVAVVWSAGAWRIT
ncbi:hypothetical protein [Sphingobium yanoikuyae]|uniref:hypothetical protein n=1 Tax=Sphingobium yanoikuyae TaxID=13690 RepID=UPI0035B44493